MTLHHLASKSLKVNFISEFFSTNSYRICEAPNLGQFLRTLQPRIHGDFSIVFSLDVHRVATQPGKPIILRENLENSGIFFFNNSGKTQWKVVIIAKIYNKCINFYPMERFPSFRQTSLNFYFVCMLYIHAGEFGLTINVISGKTWKKCGVGRPNSGKKIGIIQEKHHLLRENSEKYWKFCGNPVYSISSHCISQHHK